jgi:hypothetical protein
MNLGKPNMVRVRKIAEPDAGVVLREQPTHLLPRKLIAGLGFHPLQNRVDSFQFPLAKNYMAELKTL